MRTNLRKVIGIAGLGIAVGLALGILLGWVVWPVQYTDSDIADLRPADKTDYIIMVSAAYTLDGDLAQARARLERLNDPNVSRRISDLAEQYILKGEERALARSLALLAEALNAGTETTRKYLATPTSTATSTPAPTLTPTATFTPTPTPTRTPIPTPVPTNTATPTVPPTLTSVPSSPTPTRTRRPATLTPTPVSLAPVEWDARLNTLNVKVVPATVTRGQTYWRLTKVRWASPEESGGNVNIFVETLNPAGQRMVGVTVVVENGGRTTLVTRDKTAPDWPADFVMHGGLGSYRVSVDGGASDQVTGLGLGTVEQPLITFHTSFYLTFQRTVKP